MTREQRLVFGEDADLYDRARPGYSDAVVTSALDYLGGGSGLRALEIGVGTGKATVAFARRGIDIVGVEPDPAMAAVAARNTASFPGVRIEQAAFEEWPVEGRAFDLVFSGQARHWVDPVVRGPKAASALRPGGALALFWHRSRWADDDPIRAALDACYADHAPELLARAPGFPGLGAGSERPGRRVHEELCGSELFRDVTVRHHPWESEVDAADYRALLATQSDHRLLDEPARARLLDAVEAVIAGFGGTIRVPYDTLLVLARPAR